MKRTSLTHPLQIAVVSAGPDFGRVGITFCPGKYDRHAMTGEWVRDLALDLDRVRDWGAAAVVTLLEPKELVLLRVERLGEEILRRNMLWFHLPIVDVSIPDEQFEREWGVAGEDVALDAAPQARRPGPLPRRAWACWHSSSAPVDRTWHGANESDRTCARGTTGSD